MSNTWAKFVEHLSGHPVYIRLHDKSILTKTKAVLQAEWRSTYFLHAREKSLGNRRRIRLSFNHRLYTDPRRLSTTFRDHPAPFLSAFLGHEWIVKSRSHWAIIRFPFRRRSALNTYGCSKRWAHEATWNVCFPAITSAQWINIVATNLIPFLSIACIPRSQITSFDLLAKLAHNFCRHRDDKSWDWVRIFSLKSPVANRISEQLERTFRAFRPITIIRYNYRINGTGKNYCSRVRFKGRRGHWN